MFSQGGRGLVFKYFYRVKNYTVHFIFTKGLDWLSNASSKLSNPLKIAKLPLNFDLQVRDNHRQAVYL